MPIYNSVRWYVGELAHGDPSRNTRKAARLDLLQFVRWWEGQHSRPFDPILISAVDLHNWYATRLHDGVAPATLNRAVTILRGYCAWLTARGKLPSNPAMELSTLPTPRRVRHRLPPQTLAALLNAAKQGQNSVLRPRNVALVALLGVTGLKVQEVCDLEVGDVDLMSGMVTIQENGKRRSRKVPLRVSTHELLRHYLELRCSSCLLATGVLGSHQPLLIGAAASVVDQPLRLGLDQRTVQRIVRHLGQVAMKNLNKRMEQMAQGRDREALQTLSHALLTVTPEQLRLSAGQRLLEAGYSLAEVQQILGHQRLATTQRYLLGDADIEGSTR